MMSTANRSFDRDSISVPEVIQKQKQSGGIGDTGGHLGFQNGRRQHRFIPKLARGTHT